MPTEILSVFEPLPAQRAFLVSKAKIRGYGGAMGGGKSRTGCEQAFDYALDYPGIVVLIARHAHTSIINTTKKTMLDFVIDPRLIIQKKASGGEDYIKLWNGSIIHFVGLDDPIRWYSSEIGHVFFDEAQELERDVCLRIMTRLRQTNSRGEHMPNNAVFTFNPSNPGHWLQGWFLDGARTEFGFYRHELKMDETAVSIGDCEFVFAKATDNIHLPEGYVEQTLSGMPEWMRRRYLDGVWEFISGASFFNIERLREYQEEAANAVPLLNGDVQGDILKDISFRTRKGPVLKGLDRIRIVEGGDRLTVWKSPVRKRMDSRGEKELPEHRYIIAIDAASGRGRDYTAMQVIDVDDFEQVAEWHGKVETGVAAEIAYRLGRIYNNALIVTELTGGWGVPIDQLLKRYKYPRLYTRKIVDRLSQKYTDKTGFDTTLHTRNLVLEALDAAIREKSITINSLRTVRELGTFVYSEREKPEAQPGCNDDLVMSLAIGVKVAGDMPRQLRRLKPETHMAQFETTGY